MSLAEGRVECQCLEGVDDTENQPGVIRGGGGQKQATGRGLQVSVS